jgi:plastocyanin
MRTLRSRASVLTIAGVLSLGLTACGGGDDDGGDVAPDVTADVSVLGTDALKFDPTELTASAGEIAIELVAEPSVEHNVVIEETGDTVVVEAAAGQTAVGTIELEAGTYTFYCSIPGHRQAGMEGTLTVS